MANNPHSKAAKIVEKKALIHSPSYRHISTFLLVILEFLIIGFLYISSYSILLRAITGVISLVIIGMLLTKVNGLPGDYGIYIFGGSFGINTIEKLSRCKKNLWLFFTEWGLVLSFGVLSYFIFKGKISKKALILGELAIVFIILFIVPYFLLSFQLISIPNLPTSLSSYSLSSASFQPSLLGISLIGLAIIGGFSFFIFFELLFGAGLMILDAVSVILSVASSSPNYAPLATAVPGLAPVIPGITIPFFAGILALAVILITHEFSHGVISRIYKIKIKKVGLVLLGVIPMGAFVEPDEKKVLTLDKYKQNGIFIAGIASNFLLTFIFFVLAFLFVSYVVPGITNNYIYISAVSANAPAYNVIPVGAIIEKWNNIPINNLASLETAASNDKPNSKVTVTTNYTTYSLIANSSGKIGVLISAESATKPGVFSSILSFLYQFIILSLVLNFLVASINLLPLPFFDGWRIYKNIIKSDRTLKILSIITILTFILLALPWLFIL